MATETTSQIAAGLSAATTGPLTPNAMTVTRPAREAIWALFLAMWSAIAVTIIVLVIFAAGLGLGWWSPANKAGLVQALLWIALTSQFCVGVLTVALASSRLGQVKASAGPVTIGIEGKSE